MGASGIVRGIIAAALSIAALALPSVGCAGQLDFYEHNGSVIAWFVAGGEVKATYETPRRGLEAIGVREDSVLFTGYEESDRITGTAYAFKKGCKPAPYKVVGRNLGDQMVLRGPAPVRAKGKCTVERYTLDSPNADLVFKFSSNHH
ncbi:hypothetical protein [Brucella sp. 22210]|uniref:hypothetical protein n=1 Tax=Brucella sp. 22210 TaxID=3453892 RepID=UPI003F85CDD8